VIDSTNRIIVAGESGSGRFAVARYNTNGSLDTTFDGDGKVTTSFYGTSNDSGADAVGINSAGRIVVAGRAWNPAHGSEFALARYRSNGALDGAFSGDGKVTTSFVGVSNSEARGMALDALDGIAVAGTAWSTGGYFTFAVARYESNGSLNTAFGVDGRVLTEISGGADGRDVAFDSSGRVLVAGGSATNNGDFAVARYLGDRAPTTKLYLPLMQR
jgi:uncharacterized delta-60 repeat protein